MSLYSEVLKLIRRHKLLDGVHTAVVGLSGGPDSVCLLDLLALMAERGDISVRLHAAHLNHGLRAAESDEDEHFVRELATRTRVPLAVERRDVHAAHANGRGSLEEVARRERYSFLASVARKVRAEAVAVGHNADDQVETVLHRLVRGTGIKGIRGMAPARPIEPGSDVRLIRPLLRARRSDILEHLAERGLSFREDSSNRDSTFMRNRIRHELLPLLESNYNPAFGQALLRLSRSAVDVHHLLSDLADAEAARCVRGGTIDTACFRAVPDALRPLVIDRAVASVMPNAPQFDASHYEAVVGLALDGGPGSRLDLPGGLVAARSGNGVTFAKSQSGVPPVPIEVPLHVPGETGAAGLIVTATVLDRQAFDLDAFMRTKTRYDEAMDADAAGGPLVLRSRRNGDAFRPLGAGGRKKVGDFLTDLKLPAEERDRVLIVAAGEDLRWVVGHRIDERAKITPETKNVLVLAARDTTETEEET